MTVAENVRLFILDNFYVTVPEELSDEVCDAHIALYVNEFSVDLGDEGMVAIERLLAGAATAAA